MKYNDFHINLIFILVLGKINFTKLIYRVNLLDLDKYLTKISR